MTSPIPTPRNDRTSSSKLQNLEQRLACLVDAGPQAMDARLAELNREWTAGRASKATIALLIVVGFALTVFDGLWWLILPALGGLFLLQYLLSRTSWLGLSFYHLGFRTGFEVEQEKMALKVLGGGGERLLQRLPTVLDTENREEIARLEGEGGIAVEPETAKIDPIEAAKSAIEATEKPAGMR